MSWNDKLRGRLPAPIGDLCVASSERSSRGWVVAAVTAIGVSLAAGAGMMTKAGADGAHALDSAEAKVAQGEKRVAELDAERKLAERRLAELTKRVNASESQLADTSERVASLEKRRESLQKQVAELAGPVSPDMVERVSNEHPASGAAHDEGSPPDEMTDAAPPTPPQRPSVDEQQARPLKAASVSRAAIDDVRPEIVTSAASDPAGPVRVFIHVRSSDPAARSRARAVASELRRRGVNVAEIRGVRLPVRRDAVRYFYDQDRSAVSALQDAIREYGSPDGADPVAQDFRSFGAPPRRGTIELWLS